MSVREHTFASAGPTAMDRLLLPFGGRNTRPPPRLCGQDLAWPTQPVGHTPGASLAVHLWGLPDRR